MGVHVSDDRLGYDGGFGCRMSLGSGVGVAVLGAGVLTVVGAVVVALFAAAMAGEGLSGESGASVPT